jgi:hypothetical protein
MHARVNFSVTKIKFLARANKYRRTATRGKHFLGLIYFHETVKNHLIEAFAL